MAIKKQPTQFCDLGAIEKLDIIFNKAADAIFIHDNQGKLLDVNQTACESLGYTREDLMSKDVSQIDTPGFATKIPQRVKDIIKNGEAVFESVHVRKDKTLIPVEIKARSISYAGRPAIVSFVRDITLRKKAESELKKAKEQAERYLNVSADLVFSLDTQGNITMMNESGYRTLEYKQGELLGKNWFNTCLPISTRKDLKSVFKKLMNGNTEGVTTYENAVLTKSGREKILLWHNTLITDEDKKITGILSSAEDITELKKTKTEVFKKSSIIEASDIKYRGLIENTPMCIKVFDKEGKLLFLNKGGREEHGIKEGEDLLKWDWLGTVKPEYIPEAKRVFEGAFKGKAGEVEFEHTLESKAHPWCHGLISPILDDKGKIVNVLFYSTNISNLKREELKAKENEAMFRTLLDALPLCIKWFDAKGSLISINKNGKDEHFLSDKTDEEIKKWDYLSCIEEKNRKTVKSCMASALKGILSSAELEHVPGTTISQFCFSNFTPVFDINKKVKYVLFISHDVTQTKLRTYEIEKHAKELEKINQLMIGRENKMMDLKEKIKDLESKLQINNKV